MAGRVGFEPTGAVKPPDLQSGATLQLCRPPFYCITLYLAKINSQISSKSLTTLVNNLALVASRCLRHSDALHVLAFRIAVEVNSFNNRSIRHTCNCFRQRLAFIIGTSCLRILAAIRCM